MPYFAIVSFDIADSLAARARLQDAHQARLRQLEDAGRLLTAGALPRIDEFGQIDEGYQGSLIVAAFESPEAARQWAYLDPYNAEGLYVQTRVYPYEPAFGTRSRG